MRRCFTAERSLLFPLCYKSRHLHLSQRWYADTKAAAGNDEVLLDLLDRIGQNTTRTTNSRRQESKDVRVPQLDGLQPSIPHLPLSPLMDPKLVAARKRYRTPKPTFSGLPSKFQKKLSMSPYAQALATPIRLCQLTGVRLPSYFLLKFGITRHPITRAQWQLPKLAVDPLVLSSEDDSLVKTGTDNKNADKIQEMQPTADECDVSPQTKSTKPETLDESIEKTIEHLAKSHWPIEPASSRELKSDWSPPKPITRDAAGSWYICSQPALQHMSTFKTKARLKLIPNAWKEDSGITADKLVWRQDMDVFVLDLLRKKVFTLLKILASPRGVYITFSSGSKSIGLHTSLAAVLWLGAKTPGNIPESREQLPSSGTSASQEEVVGDVPPLGEAAPSQELNPAGHIAPSHTEVNYFESTEPPPYAMIKGKNHYIPIYNVPTLLGPEYLARLRGINTSFAGTMAFIKMRKQTVKAQMELWKLMGYLAQAETQEGNPADVRYVGKKEG